MYTLAEVSMMKSNRELVLELLLQTAKLEIIPMG